MEDNPSTEPVTSERKVTFSIKDESDNGIGGATVKIGSTSKTTGSAGGCSFDNITDGKVTVTVSADGYTTKTETITVSESNTTFTITLTESS